LEWLGTISRGENQYLVQPKDRFLFAIGTIEVKTRLIEALKEQGAVFLTMIHPKALVSDSAHIGLGVVICPFALVSVNAEINDFAMINFYASCAHDSSVGAYSILSPYATLNGFAKLERETFLGTHSTVTANRTVGVRSKVSANSVVMTDIPPRSVVYGVPGKHRTIFF
jgi:sugar O-acyltransferase (sialic acid O-acetyltransferase NeuD family)